MSGIRNLVAMSISHLPLVPIGSHWFALVPYVGPVVFQLGPDR